MSTPRSSQQKQAEAPRFFPPASTPATTLNQKEPKDLAREMVREFVKGAIDRMHEKKVDSKAADYNKLGLALSIIESPEERKCILDTLNNKVLGIPSRDDFSPLELALRFSTREE